jgi:hypothetical protein
MNIQEEYQGEISCAIDGWLEEGFLFKLSPLLTTNFSIQQKK